MNIQAIRSDVFYRKMMTVSKEEKDAIYRYELMKPFEAKWQCIGVPLKSDIEGGNDVISTNILGGGYAPSQITIEKLPVIDQISNDAFWRACETSIRRSLEGFEENGIDLPTQDYIFTILLNDPENPMAAMTGDYCGDGGIPGYILGTIIPNERSLQMLPVALAHEANHNVRWQFMPWTPHITLGDLIVSEGLAENFATAMFGEDKIGKWFTETTPQTLETIIKPIIKENINETDFNKLFSFLYGDEIMVMRGAAPIGMPYCAGYACGYQLVKHYLQKTGKSIYQATLTSTKEILQESYDFWG